MSGLKKLHLLIKLLLSSASSSLLLFLSKLLLFRLRNLKFVSTCREIFFSKIHLAIEEQPPVFLERFVFPKAGFS